MIWNPMHMQQNLDCQKKKKRHVHSYQLGSFSLLPTCNSDSCVYNVRSLLSSCNGRAIVSYASKIYVRIFPLTQVVLEFQYYDLHQKERISISYEYILCLFFLSDRTFRLTK